MRILITGATGLVGKDLGVSLVQEGHEIVVLSRSKEKALIDLPFPAEAHTWAGQGPVPSAALQNVDAVVNLMGENISTRRWNALQKRSIRNSRIQATQDLVRSFKDHGHFPKVWIQASAIGYYGDTEKMKNETSSAGHDFMAEVCRDWEEACELPAEVRKVITRIGVVLSHKGGILDKLVPLFLSGLGSALGRGQQQMSFIHLQDLVGFIQHALRTSRVQGVYNLVGEKSVSNLEFTQKLALGLHIWRAPSVPSPLLRMVLGEMAQIVLANQPVVSKRMAESGYSLKYSTFDSMWAECTTWYQDPYDSGKSCSVLWREQFLPNTIADVFPYFSEASNLEKITPEFLNFKIISVSTPVIAKETEIKYRLKLYGVPMGWRTRIAEWEPGVRFVDNQEEGPYTRWYHEHRFQPLGRGTLMQDWVRYRVPFGPLGLLAAGFFIRNNIEKIFAHRRKIANVIRG